MRKRILCVLAGAALLAVTPACSLAAESAAEETLETKMEGDGFDTPEEALTAYIEAFKKMDMNGMVSVYAMESFLENLDLEALVEKQQVYSFRTRYNYIPQENPYASALNLEKRRSWITDLVQQQYVTLSGSGLYTEYPGMMIQVKDFGDVQNLLDTIFPEKEQGFLENLNLMQFIDPGILSENDLSESFREKNIEENCSMYGAEDYQCVAASLQLDGKNWLITFDTIKYGGRWYLAEPGGIIGMQMGITAESGVSEVTGLNLD